MPNPLISQGSLNRLIAAVQWNDPDMDSFNITASYLGKDGIRLALDGIATTFINTMTGAVTSPEPYQSVSLTIALLKSQPIAKAYKNRVESNALMGACTIYPDSGVLPVYVLQNCALESLREMSYNGEDAGWVISVKGYYEINAFMWDYLPLVEAGAPGVAPPGF